MRAFFIFTAMAKQLQVMMLEDDTDDHYLTEEVIKDLGFDLQISFYSNSDKFFQALAQTKPGLLLVDYNSTPQNALAVLKQLKKDNNYRTIPVVVLTDSDHPKYRDECYAEGASTVVVKPRSLQETTNKINSFFTYWTEVADS